MRLPVSGRITARHGQWITTAFYRGRHKGYDFAVRMNTPVQSTSPGRVTVAGWQTGYGRVVYVQHGTLQVRYAHLNGFAVKVGDSVKTGQVIAYSGNTGWSTGPHLHWEARVNGKAVDPISYNIPTRSGRFWVRVDKRAANVRSGASTSHGLAGTRVLYRGNRFQATELVTGQKVSGNNKWYRSWKGNYVWSGGLTRL